MDYKGMGKDSAKLLWNKIKAKFLSKDTKYAASDSVGGNAIKANTSVGVTDFNDASRNIKIGYSGNSLTAGEVGYLAGYNSAGNIKDISKNEAKEWLGINGGSQTTPARGEISFSITVTKNSYARYTKDIPTKAGYTPVLAMPKGTSNRNVLCYGYEIQKNNGKWQVETKWTNVSDADRTCTAEVYILYVKN